MNIFLGKQTPYELDISPADRVVFIHIAKTAGTTFQAILELLLCGFSRYPEYLLNRIFSSKLEKIREYQLFMGHFTYSVFSEIIFPEGFIGLTFLREPVSRTISNFKFIQQLARSGDLPGYEHEIERVKNMSFNEFLSTNDLNLSRDTCEIQTTLLGATSFPFHKRLFKFIKSIFNKRERGIEEKLFLSSTLRQKTSRREYRQAAWLDLLTAQARLKNMAFIGLTEKFQESLYLLSYTFGWRPLKNQIHLNATMNSETDMELDDEILKLIKNKNKLDIKLYNFGKKLFELRYDNMIQTLLYRNEKHRQSKIKAAPSTELILDLLEKHYEFRRDRRYETWPNRNNSSEYLFYPNMYAEGAFGWHALENSTVHGPVRWSGPDLESGYDFPFPAETNVRISFRILMVLDPEIIRNLVLSANGVIIPTDYFMDDQGAFIFSGTIPFEILTGIFIRIVFFVPTTIAPASLGNLKNADSRLLGFLLNWVKFEK